jgi:hypothetical protein
MWCEGELLMELVGGWHDFSLQAGSPALYRFGERRDESQAN